MHTRIHVILWVVLLGAGLLLPAAGCGGGGGSSNVIPPPVDVSLLNGTYFSAFFLASDEAPATDEALVQWGTAAADGAGGLVVTGSSNENGFINPPGATTYTYTVASDRSWALQQAGMEMIRGGVSSDGRIAGGAVVHSGVPPGINLMIRREGSWTTASLNGVYHMCSLRLEPSTGDMQAWWGMATFDGLGGVAFSYSQNTEGAVVGPGIGGPSTYNVLADGTTTISAPPTSPFEGGILLGGDVVVVSGSTSATRDPGLMIMIRQSTAASAATATGTFSLAGLSRDGGGFSSITGPAVFDGTSNVTVTLTRNEDGVVSADPVQTVPYTVNPNGTLIVTPGGTESFIGAIAPDGRFAMLAGETTGSSSPQIVFMLR